jgi:hypothetical protein
MGLLNTYDDEVPDPLILPEDPEDLLEIDPIVHLERMLDAGVPFDVIDQRMDAFFGRASGNTAPSTTRRPKPMARATPARSAPLTDNPDLDEFLRVAGPDNPHRTTRELTQYWAQKYGPVDPKTLPSLETFLPAAKQDNPNHSESALTRYWQDRYGALGAPEKNSVAPSPGLLGTANEVARKTAASVVDVAKAVGRKVTNQQNPPIQQNSLPRPPSLLEFVKANRPLNPHLSIPEIARIWNRDWGPVNPATLPSKETFLAKNKPLNPDVPEAELAQHWADHYGSLGAPEKNPPAVPKMTGQATATRQ